MKQDGGAAFARPIGEWGDTNGQYNSPQDGMTMRQWYKGMAIGKMSTDAVREMLSFFGEEKRNVVAKNFAEMIGQLADAMLAEDAAHEGGGDER